MAESEYQWMNEGRDWGVRKELGTHSEPWVLINLWEREGEHEKERERGGIHPLRSSSGGLRGKSIVPPPPLPLRHPQWWSSCAFLYLFVTCPLLAGCSKQAHITRHTSAVCAHVVLSFVHLIQFCIYFQSHFLPFVININSHLTATRQIENTDWIIKH